MITVVVGRAVFNSVLAIASNDVVDSVELTLCVVGLAENAISLLCVDGVP